MYGSCIEEFPGVVAKGRIVSLGAQCLIKDIRGRQSPPLFVPRYIATGLSETRPIVLIICAETSFLSSRTFNFFGKTILVVNKKFRLFWAHPHRKGRLDAKSS